MSDNVYDQTPAPDQLILGTFALASPETVANRAYDVETLAADATFGDPVPIEQEIRSLLLDGSRVKRLRDGNRESYFVVRIKAKNPIALAQGEADLRAELYKSNTLKWTPPHALVPTSAFVVVTSSFRWLFDDHRETQLTRIFGVRFVCLPHVRSDFEVLVPALATPPAGEPTVTSINAASSTTGWTGSSTPTTDGSSVIIKPADAANPQIWPPTTRWAKLTIAATNPTPYIRVKAHAARGTITALTLEVDGAAAANPVLVDGNDYYFVTADTSVTTLKINASISQYLTNTVSPQALYVDDVSKYSRLPSFGSGRQLTRTIDVLGSERTPGSIEMTAGSSLSNLAIIHTIPDDGTGYTPQLSTAFLSGSSATQAAYISGKDFTITSANVFEKPLAQIPEGRYELAALVVSTLAGTYAINWTAQVYVSGVAVGEQLSGSANGTWTGAGREYVTLGRMLLPPTRAAEANPNATLRITIQAASPANHLDEAWIFNLTDGALTVVKTNSWCVFLDGAAVDELTPSAWAGNSSDRSDAYALSRRTEILAIGQHIWRPGRTQIFTATRGPADVPVALRYTPAWSHHPALLEAP